MNNVLRPTLVCMSRLTPLSAFHSAKGGDLSWTVVSYLLCTSLVDVDLTVFAPYTLPENTLELVRKNGGEGVGG